MDKKIFNEKDSLELITEMIRSAKQRLEKNSGLPFLISGYLIIIMITASWFLLNHHPYWNLLLFSVPILGFLSIPLTNGLLTKEKKNNIDKIINYTWLILALGLLVAIVTGLPEWGFQMIFYKTTAYFLLFIGIGIAITGVTIRFKLFIFLGLISIFSSLFPLPLYFFEKTNYIIWLANVLIILTMIIPGHILYYKSRKSHV